MAVEPGLDGHEDRPGRCSGVQHDGREGVVLPFPCWMTLALGGWLPVKRESCSGVALSLLRATSHKALAQAATHQRRPDHCRLGGLSSEKGSTPCS